MRGGSGFLRVASPYLRAVERKTFHTSLTELKLLLFAEVPLPRIEPAPVSLLVGIRRPSYWCGLNPFKCVNLSQDLLLFILFKIFINPAKYKCCNFKTNCFRKFTNTPTNIDTVYVHNHLSRLSSFTNNI